MTYYPISAERVAAKLAERIEEDAAELKALEAVKIKTSHNKLTNAAVSAEGDDVAARIGDYLGIDKALYINYVVIHADGRRQYKSRDVTAYSYEDEAGQSLGANGCIRISRTITPSEMRAELDKIIAARRDALAKMRAELKRAATITRQYNAIEAKKAALLDGVTYATRRALEGR